LTVTRHGASYWQPDHIEADDWSAMGDQPVWIGDSTDTLPKGVQSVLIGIDKDGTLKCSAPDAFDVLLTARPDAPAPWISVPANRLAAHAETLADAVRLFPFAATMLVRVLRLTEALPFSQALDVESLAYSTLLGGQEFNRWCATQPKAVAAFRNAQDLISVSRDKDHVTITLDDPARDNAMTAAMRDALYGALANLLDDPSSPTLSLIGNGRCFSTGGHLPEFGTARDVAQAHVVRTLHSCAQALHDLAERARVYFHGACIGSGLEIPAAAYRRIATPDAWFQLPELRMGLIPGAGGSVTVGRAIGRHRTAWMVLSGKRVSARQGLAMGLIQAIQPR
jgi:1,4-dihydroxy-2-naphthoyl-CoA synthase